MPTSLSFEENLQQKGYSQPARDYEEALGLTGIAATYVMPGGKSMEEMECDVIPAFANHPLFQDKRDKFYLHKS